MSSEAERVGRTPFGGVIAVWVAAVVIGVLVGVLTPSGQRAQWFAIGLAGCLVLSFAVQLWAGRPQRFISRVALSILGSLVVLGAISAVFGLVAAAAG
ncbi:hypothetical protein ET475_01270 [Microbacterium protaetiae]|uniref:Uncharacterized protein n=1 Tax=Microbacterium protaetiae TaxID=2509458 RepID=A0A4P6EFA0_9MICO|nr:hypothetical protein [Microbacterium protaetiae]QAY58767.1 hypothetical protein ET475_01270 [Microbacterium protaetiae]